MLFEEVGGGGEEDIAADTKKKARGLRRDCWILKGLQLNFKKKERKEKNTIYNAAASV